MRAVAVPTLESAAHSAEPVEIVSVEDSFAPLKIAQDMEVEDITPSGQVEVFRLRLEDVIYNLQEITRLIQPVASVKRATKVREVFQRSTREVCDACKRLEIMGDCTTIVPLIDDEIREPHWRIS